jgi:hypothetical protein
MDGQHSGALAVDVVLLLPEPVAAWAKTVNAVMNERTGDRRVVLGDETGIPHISLAMAAVSAADLTALGARLDAIAAGHLPLALYPEGIATVTLSSGDAVSGLNLETTAGLRALHHAVMEATDPFRLSVVRDEMIHGHEAEEISAFTAEYIAGYPRNAAFSHFSPHITLGYWAVDRDLGPGPGVCMFRATRLAVCHLGNNCTCGRILSVHAAPGRV